MMASELQRPCRPPRQRCVRRLRSASSTLSVEAFSATRNYTMRNRPRIIAATGIVLLVAVCPASRSQPPQPPKADPSGQALSKQLKQSGYVEVALTPNKTGWLDVKAELDKTAMLLCLDTGAEDVVLDRTSATRAKLEVKAIPNKKAPVFGGFIEVAQTKINELSVGGLSCPAESLVIDLSTTNATRKQIGDPPCDGLL